MGLGWFAGIEGDLDAADAGHRAHAIYVRAAGMGIDFPMRAEQDDAEPVAAGAAPDWTRAVKGLPPGKEPVKLRIDSDVLRWFRGTGKGYQTRMNNVLRAFVESRKSAGR